MLRPFVVLDFVAVKDVLPEINSSRDQKTEDHEIEDVLAQRVPVQIDEGENVYNDAVNGAIYEDIEESEPNNDFSGANEVNLDLRIHARIYNAGDEDFYKFNIREKGILYIKMYEVPQGLRPSIKIYDTSVPGRTASSKGGSATETIIFAT